MAQVDQFQAGYTFVQDDSERARLVQQANDLRDHVVTLTNVAGIGAGDHVLDLGCGPCGAIGIMSELVGPAGRVVAMDINPDNLIQARQYVQANQLANVEVVEGDATNTGFAEGSFDAVHARLLLVNIPDPGAVVAEMLRLVKPGGWVLSDEADCELFMCHPPSPACLRLHDLFNAVFRASGADPFIGRRVPELFRRAGLCDVGVEQLSDFRPFDHPRRMLIPDVVKSLAPKIIQEKLADVDELAALDQQARQHLGDPNTLAVTFLYFLTSGRKASD